MLLPSSSLLGPDGSIDFDLECTTCGYSLQGRRARESCPDCGTPLDETILNVPLVLLGPARLKRISRSFLLFAAGPFAIAIVWILWLASIPQFGSQGPSLEIAFVARALIFMISSGIGCLGVSIDLMELSAHRKSKWNDLTFLLGMATVALIPIILLFTYGPRPPSMTSGPSFIPVFIGLAFFLGHTLWISMFVIADQLFGVRYLHRKINPFRLIQVLLIANLILTAFAAFRFPARRFPIGVQPTAQTLALASSLIPLLLIPFAFSAYLQTRRTCKIALWISNGRKTPLTGLA